MRSLRHFFRLFYITLVLSRYGMLALIWGAKPRSGQSLASTLTALGPTFIKLGQTLSTRPDLIGAMLADDLARLRDDVAPFPVEKAIRTIERELSQPLSTLFLEFDHVPAAAASIAQVHFARTQDGREVAVKILRPGIERRIARDLELMEWLAAKIEHRFKEGKRLKPCEVVQMLRQSILMEIDLRFEAAAAEELKQNLRDEPGIHIPTIDWNLSSAHVLTAERLRGAPISDLAKLKAAGQDPDKLIATLSSAFFRMAFRDGFFHADLHPGNMFVLADGKIGLVDFGIMGRLSLRDRIHVAEIFRGFINEDYLHVARTHFDAGYVPRHHSIEAFAQACMAIGKPTLRKKLNEISLGQLLGQLFMVSKTFDMETQPQLLLLQKNLVLVEGVGRMLDPNVNMWKMAEPLIADWARHNLGLHARMKIIAEDAKALLGRLPELVALLQKKLEEETAQGGKHNHC